MATLRKRLDVYIKAELRSYVTEESERTGRPMNAITDELLTFAIAYKRGEVIEQQALPMIREVISTALHKHRAELRAELHEDLVDTLREATHKSTERLVASVTRTIRDVSTTKRLVYALMARTCSPEFARETYEAAREKVGPEEFLGRADNHPERWSKEPSLLFHEKRL